MRHESRLWSLKENCLPESFVSTVQHTLSAEQSENLFLATRRTKASGWYIENCVRG